MHLDDNELEEGEFHPIHKEEDKSDNFSVPETQKPFPANTTIPANIPLSVWETETTLNAHDIPSQVAPVDIPKSTENHMPAPTYNTQLNPDQKSSPPQKSHLVHSAHKSSPTNPTHKLTRTCRSSQILNDLPCANNFSSKHHNSNDKSGTHSKQRKRKRICSASRSPKALSHLNEFTGQIQFTLPIPIIPTPIELNQNPSLSSNSTELAYCEDTNPKPDEAHQIRKIANDLGFQIDPRDQILVQIIGENGEKQCAK
ncbi:hypothetical protein LXL04_019201 [Taraxacum kok-saghyz]